MLFFSAGVGRAGTFCVIYSAVRELNGTGDIGKAIRWNIITNVRCICHLTWFTWKSVKIFLINPKRDLNSKIQDEILLLETHGLMLEY